MPEAEHGEAGPAGRAPPQEGNAQLSGCRGFTRSVEKLHKMDTYFFKDKKSFFGSGTAPVPMESPDPDSQSGS